VLHARLVTQHVENLSGHKFPTAFPSRRAWLHFTVHDHGGRVVFESGALRPDGSIVGNDNDADPRRFEPHYAAINSTEQVEIYEERRKRMRISWAAAIGSGTRSRSEQRRDRSGWMWNSGISRSATGGRTT
jgi:hypothetical protein